MATIEEMAAKHAYYERSDDLPNEGGYDLQKLESYFAGANAVLEEIEKTLNADRILSHPFPTKEMRLWSIQEKIKELKGE